MTTNQISFAKLVEDARHNKAYETEVNRHNLVSESQGAQSILIADKQANAAWQNAQAAWKNAQTNVYNAESNAMNAWTNAQRAYTDRLYYHNQLKKEDITKGKYWTDILKNVAGTALQVGSAALMK